MLLEFHAIRKLSLRTDCCLKFQEEVLRESPDKCSKLLANHCLKGSVTMQKQLVSGFPPLLKVLTVHLTV